MSAREVITNWFIAEAAVGPRDTADIAACVEGTDKLLAHLARHGLAVLPVEPTQAMVECGRAGDANST